MPHSIYHLAWKRYKFELHTYQWLHGYEKFSPQRFGVSKNCVQKLVTQKRTKGHILPGKQGGSMVSPVMKYKAQLIAIFEKQNDATLAEYCELLYDETGLWVSQSTMCRT